MASCPLPCRKIVKHHPHNRAPPPIYSCAAATSNRKTSFSSPYPYSFKLNRRNSVPPNSKCNSSSVCCRAADPQSEPPQEEHLSRVTTTFTKFQDTLQIFVAVLFWMSLFFWSSIWDGESGGRPNKPSRFRK